MAKEKICEINVGKLMGEYHNLNNEILVKSSYLDGVKSRIADEAEEYFIDYRGKYYRMSFEGCTSDDTIVRIGKIKVDFSGSYLAVRIYLVVNPDDLNKEVKWTRKEKQLLNKAKMYWKQSDDDWYFGYYDEIKAISAELMMLKNGVSLVKDNFYYFNETELMSGHTVCKENYVLGKRHDLDVMLNMYEGKEK